MTSAGTVAEALKRIVAESPDVVLLDLGLPDGDGKDVIRRAREWSDLTIIVLSARERETEKIEALDIGADDYEERLDDPQIVLTEPGIGYRIRDT